MSGTVVKLTEEAVTKNIKQTRAFDSLLKNVDDTTLFAKLIKKSEEAAQAAV